MPQVELIHSHFVTGTDFLRNDGLNTMLKMRFRQADNLTTLLFAAIFWITLFGGCGQREPFQLVTASGKVTYEDGTPIPVDSLTLTFFPQTASATADIHPRPGVAVVDAATGQFKSVTTHKANDGLVFGKHKVVLGMPGGVPPLAVVPRNYIDLATTPLQVDTDKQPFVLQVKKPR